MCDARDDLRWGVCPIEVIMNRDSWTAWVVGLALASAAALTGTACSDDETQSSTSSGTSSTTTTTTTTSTATAGGGGEGQGGQGGSTSSACETGLFCDDFEAYTPAAAPGSPWTVFSVSGAATVATDRSWSGGKSVKVTTEAADGFKSAMIVFEDAAVLPTSSNVVHGRMMFFLESAPTDSMHWTFVEGRGLVPGQDYTAAYRYGGQHPVTENNNFLGSQLMANYETPDVYQDPPVGPASDCWRHSDKKVVPVGVWACAEWSFDGPGNEMRFWLDGTEIPDLTIQSTGDGCGSQPATFEWTAPSFTRFHLGWESYQPDAVRTMWIDDVVLSDQPIGCPSPN